VNTIEDRLRDAYRAAAETVQPETIRDLPSQATRPARSRARSRRTRALIPLAAAAAVTAVVTGLAVTVSLLGTGSRQPGGTPSLGPGVPLFYVEALKINPLEVYDTATGQVVATIQAPKGTFFDGQVAALAGDRTFLTAATPGSLSTDLNPCVSRLYEFQLNDAGQPGPLIPLHITVPGWLDGSNSLSVTPDGRMIAYATDLGCRPIAGSSLEIGVINLVTRQVRSWTLRQQTGMDVIYSVALSADGRQLVFSQGSFPATAPSTTVVRILPTSAPPGSFDQRSTVVPRSADGSWAALNADGGLLYMCSRPMLGVLAGGRSTGAVTYSIESIAGGLQHVIASWSPQQYPICGASLDTSGRYLLIQLVKQAPVNVCSGSAMPTGAAPASRRTPGAAAKAASRPTPGISSVQVNCTVSEQNRLVLVDLRTGQLRNLRRSGPSPGMYAGIPASIAW
jgi:hypothetical protein